MCIGSLSSISLWVGTYPYDLVKTVYQADSLIKPKFKSSFQAMRTIYQRNGIQGFKKGFIPCIARAPVVYAACILGYEQSLSMTYHILE